MPVTYYSGGRRFNWRALVTPGVRFIVLACTAVFLVQTLTGLFFGKLAAFRLDQWLGLIPYAVTHGFRIWQPFTYIFLHAGPGHLIINMFVLWMFGRELDSMWGWRRFLNYFFLCGVGAGLIIIAVKTIPVFFGYPPESIPTIGASGAIFGVLIANAVLFPDRQVFLIPFPVSIPMRAYVAVMVVFEFFSTLGSSGDGVSHICHLGGGLIGWLYLRRDSFLFRVRNGYTDWKVQRTRKRFQVYLNRHKDEPPSRPDRWVN
jgi:membrane associated rhomboid family serine protease